ncbi:hypothetical protein CVO77_12945 [Sphingopyxis lindanitolerans]|uniref:Uncharacterized protein n=2 Tax=Sphingopyxis lindanitolerans TaxID=2054227 RepID=A0A2S8B0Z1_9SPHN|nr:hypothetical protein CVO77_12945 [Sphingopyxis lindanitolerans]
MTDRLWINRWGKQMGAWPIPAQIVKRTHDAFGRHIWPHLARSIAATSLARLLLSEVRVNDREIRISGSKAVLARSAAAGVAKTTPQFSLLFENGAPDRIRTCDVPLGIREPQLRW